MSRGGRPALLALVLLGCAPALAADRVSIADPALAVTVRTALQRGADRCLARVYSEFRVVPPRGRLEWVVGDVATCDAGRFAAYWRVDQPATIAVCPAFARLSPSAQIIATLHEKLHAAGVHEGHDRTTGQDVEFSVNRRIVEVCR